ncbi:MAG: FG-GAP repeat protein [Ferruginibacter sp.]|nr:hypothetical protein [Ferruginibacter sp.]
MKKISAIVFLLCIYASTYAQPANDEPCGAIALTPTTATTLPTTCTPATVLTWTGATNSTTSPLPNCGSWSTAKKDVWYKITVVAGVDSILINTSAGSGATPTTDAVMILYSATACDGTFTQLACVDDVLGSSMPLIKTAIPNAGVYYIRICDYSLSANGNINICVNLKQQHPTIDPTKRVGIGTANPEYNLDVNGTTKVRSDLTIDNITKTKDLTITNNVKIEGGSPAIGKVLTSDAAGNATWQEKSSNGGVGFGSWGDCSMNNVSEYNPIPEEDSLYNSQLGASVYISGNYAISGAPNFSKVGAPLLGSANIYQYNDGKWLLYKNILNQDGKANDRFGKSVMISADYAIIGSPYDDIGTNNLSDEGSVSIFKLEGADWVFMQKIVDASGSAGDGFGWSVSISNNKIIVGSPYDDVGTNINQGSASIYNLIGSTWVLMQKLTQSSGVQNDQFGYSVSISGNSAMVGIPFKDVGTNTDQGIVINYQLFGTWYESAILTDINGLGFDNFGKAVSNSGEYAVVGAPWTDIGSNIDQGAVFTYKYLPLNTGGGLALMNKLFDINGVTNDNYGSSVCINDNLLIVGVDIGNSTTQGSAVMYQRVGLQWRKVQKVLDPGSGNNDNFGISVGIDGINKRFLIGASFIGSVIFGKLNL